MTEENVNVEATEVEVTPVETEVVVEPVAEASEAVEPNLEAEATPEATD